MTKFLKTILLLVSMLSVSALLSGCSQATLTSDEVRVELQSIVDASKKEMLAKGLVEELTSGDESYLGNKHIYSLEAPEQPVSYSKAEGLSYFSNDIEAFIPNVLSRVMLYQAEGTTYSKSDNKYTITQLSEEGAQPSIMIVTVKDGKIGEIKVSSEGVKSYIYSLKYSLSDEDNNLVKSSKEINAY